MDFKIMDPEVVKQRLEKHVNSPRAAQANTSPSATAHPALNGKRVTDVDGGAGVYFIWDGGKKSGIPDPATYESIFGNWDGILGLKLNDLDLIADGASITQGAGVVRPDGSGDQYFFTDNKKYGIVNPNVLAYCDFRDALVVRPPGILAAVPNGAFTIDYGA